MDGLYNFLNENSIYIVMIIMLIVWGGIFSFIWSTDKRLKKIEKELEASNEQ